MERNTIFPFTKEEIDLCKYIYKEFKLRPQQYIKMLEEQNYVCAICKGSDVGKRLAVDHCHSSGKVRGLLCQKCNMGLGHFEDSIYYLKEAVKYLTKSEDTF